MVLLIFYVVEKENNLMIAKEKRDKDKKSRQNLVG